MEWYSSFRLQFHIKTVEKLRGVLMLWQQLLQLFYTNMLFTLFVSLYIDIGTFGISNIGVSLKWRTLGIILGFFIHYYVSWIMIAIWFDDVFTCKASRTLVFILDFISVQFRKMDISPENLTFIWKWKKWCHDHFYSIILSKFNKHFALDSLCCFDLHW